MKKFRTLLLLNPQAVLKWMVNKNAIIAKGKWLKKKKTSQGRRRFKSGLEIALAKKRKLSIRQLHSQMSQVI